MKSHKKYTGLNNSKSMLILVAAIIVIGVGIVLLTSLTGDDPSVSLMEGGNYEIENLGQGKYQIVDDTGNIIELTRVRSMDSAVFQDKNGKRYIFVSGSPYRFIRSE